MAPARDEFELIDWIARLAGRAPRPPEVRVAIGDDAAVLRLAPGEEFVVSTDAAVEGVHFRRDRMAAATAGRRAVAAALSDLAAMGAVPRGLLLAAASPAARRSWLEGMLRGALAAARRHRCPVVGGNLSRAGEISLTSTAVGSVPRGRALRRDTARPGDRILVTGTLGRSALALLRSERRGAPLRQVPQPRLRAGRALLGLRGAGACIDVSDGLAADLGHLLRASGVGARVDPAALPRPRGFERACAELGADPLALLVGGGEDFELLFTLRPGAPSPGVLRHRLGVEVTEIGTMERRPGLRGLPGELGFRHF